MRVFNINLLCVLAFCASACGRRNAVAENVLVAPSSGLAIAAIAADFSSSQLDFQNLENGLPAGEVQSLLKGESGIPWPVTLGDRLYFFNRAPTSSNFRSFATREKGAAPTAQLRTPFAASGDPHAAMLLGGERMLLAHYTASKLVIVNATDGALIQELKADWDLGADAKAVLRPEALFRPQNSPEIYVLHQGRKADFSGYNNSQQLFILKDDGQTLAVVDTDPIKERVQGISLHIFNPQIIDGKLDAWKPIVAGFCTVFDSASPCISGFEEVDLKLRTSKLVFDLSGASERGNGSIVAARDGKFYAAVATVDAAGTYKSQIRAYDLQNLSAKTFYEIADKTYAAYALGYDPSAHSLYIGEKSLDRRGQLSIFALSQDSSAPAALVSLPLPPADIAFTP